MPRTVASVLAVARPLQVGTERGKKGPVGCMPVAQSQPFGDQYGWRRHGRAKRIQLVSRQVLSQSSSPACSNKKGVDSLPPGKADSSLCLISDVQNRASRQHFEHVHGQNLPSQRERFHKGCAFPTDKTIHNRSD